MFDQLLIKLFRPSLIANSHAQAGEDRVLDFLFSTMGIRTISYIDIGANHPTKYNNTYLFYCKKGRGVLIEPDPVFTKVLKKARPGDIVVNAAISDKGNGVADFYIFDEPSINTLSKEEAGIRQQSGKNKLKAMVQIPMLTIEDIIKDQLGNALPLLISLDVEGVDYAVLNAFDFNRYPVPVWVVETCSYSEGHIKPKEQRIIDLMLSKGYFVYADTYVNSIFVNRDWFNNYAAKR